MDVFYIAEDVMSKDKRDGWLKLLKVGDTVLVENHYRSDPKMVSNITPTGYIVVEGLKFDAWGSCLSRSGYNRSWLKEATSEELLILDKQKLLSELSYTITKINRFYRHERKAIISKIDIGKLKDMVDNLESILVDHE